MKCFKYLQILFLVSLVSCESNTNASNEEPLVLTDEVEVYVADKIDNSLVFAIYNGGTEAKLLDKKGNELYEWVLDDNLGNDLELLPDGRLLGMFKADIPQITFGGFGGKIKIVNIDGTIDWEFEYSSSDYIAHHDVEMLPNGNVLFIVWERVAASEAQALGINVITDLYTEALIEVNPSTNQIEWEWHSIDHLVQDVDPNLPNYGQIDENPQLIDHSYVFNNNDLVGDDGDIMHANGIDYDAVKDVIYLSVNFYGEVWVIDHSTTKAEAASHAGGNYGKGGDLIYRFGNPGAYNNTQGDRMFYKVHFPNLLEGNEPGSGNVLVFMNGTNANQSTVYELKMPSNFNLQTNQNNEPEVVWSFTDPDMYVAIISGAVRLDNGNTLICEGDFGFWEVTPQNEVVWKYNGGGEQKYWRAYNYSFGDSAITSLGL